MPSLKHIFRVLLILALCVDGVASAGVIESKGGKVKLLKPHTHGGKDHPKDAELDVDKATAEWLRNAGVVEKDQAAEASAAAVAKT